MNPPPEDLAHAMVRRSIHRRTVAQARLRARRRLRLIFIGPALVGWGLALWQITQPAPIPVLVIGGALAGVPFLATFDVLGAES